MPSMKTSSGLSKCCTWSARWRLTLTNLPHEIKHTIVRQVLIDATTSHLPMQTLKLDVCLLAVNRHFRQLSLDALWTSFSWVRLTIASNLEKIVDQVRWNFPFCDMLQAIINYEDGPKFALEIGLQTPENLNASSLEFIVPFLPGQLLCFLTKSSVLTRKASTHLHVQLSYPGVDQVRRVSKFSQYFCFFPGIANRTKSIHVAHFEVDGDTINFHQPFSSLVAYAENLLQFIIKLNHAQFSTHIDVFSAFQAATLAKRTIVTDITSTTPQSENERVATDTIKVIRFYYLYLIKLQTLTKMMLAANNCKEMNRLPLYILIIALRCHEKLHKRTGMLNETERYCLHITLAESWLAIAYVRLQLEGQKSCLSASFIQSSTWNNPIRRMLHYFFYKISVADLYSLSEKELFFASLLQPHSAELQELHSLVQQKLNRSLAPHTFTILQFHGDATASQVWQGDPDLFHIARRSPPCRLGYPRADFFQDAFPERTRRITQAYTVMAQYMCIMNQTATDLIRRLSPLQDFQPRKDLVSYNIRYEVVQLRPGTHSSPYETAFEKSWLPCKQRIKMKGTLFGREKREFYADCGVYEYDWVLKKSFPKF